jgi:hypothetical protein
VNDFILKASIEPCAALSRRNSSGWATKSSSTAGAMAFAVAIDEGLVTPKTIRERRYRKSRA